MSAVLSVLAGTARLSRRDRAAMQLALEALRVQPWIWDARCALHLGWTAAEEIRDAVPDEGDLRIARARLALLLRLVLRCDAATREEPGAYPPQTWRLTYWLRDQDTTVLVQRWERLKDDPEHDPRDSIERVVPLWEQAPATRAR